MGKLWIFLMCLAILGLYPSADSEALDDHPAMQNLFPEIPRVDLVAITPMWPTTTGPNVLALDNTAPGGIASDGKYLYVSDTNNNRVLIFDLNNLTDQAKAVKVIGQNDMYSRIPSDDIYGLYHPRGIATDGKWLFIADNGNLRLVAYNLTTLEAHVVPVPCGQIEDLAFDGNWLYTTATCAGTGRSLVIYTNILEFLNGETEFLENITLITEGGCSAIQVEAPVGLSVDDKYLYVTDRGNSRVLIWDKQHIADNTPADYVIGYTDFECKDKVEDPAGSFEGVYGVASNGKYIFVDDGRGRILVFNRSKLSNGMLADYVIGRKDFNDVSLRQVATKSELAVPRGLFADDKYLYVADKNFYNPSVLLFNLSKLENGMEADYMLSIFWPRNPKYDIDIADGKLFVAGQEYIGVFEINEIENYQYPSLYIGGPFGGGLGGVGVSSDGQHLCIIAKDGTIGIYNEIPDEPRDPDITIKEIGKYGIIAGGAVSGIACRDGKLAAVSSSPTDSKVLVWKSMPTEDNQEPDVCLTKAAGVSITEPYNVFIYNDTLFVAEHIGSRVLIYHNISQLTDNSEPDLIIDKIGGAIHDIFYDGNYLFISAGSGIHIYRELPESNREADEVITYVNISTANITANYKLDPWGIYFDGNYLWVMTGCSEHYSFLIRIPTKYAEALPPPDKLMKDDFKEYIENGTFPDFLKPFEGILHPLTLDLNGDGEINVLDLVSLVNIVIRGEWVMEADVNGDGELNALDIADLINILLKG